MESVSPSALSKERREFLVTELERVNGHIPVIYDTRDRFFANFMTVSLALYGFLGLLFKEPPKSHDAIQFAFFMLVVLAVLGFGTLFLVTGNWLARDYYRQRRGRVQRMLLESDSEVVKAELQAYLKFTRDLAVWRFRPTSIYFIYNTAIAISNGIAIVFAIHIAFRALSMQQMAVSIVVLGIAQHAVTITYLWLYRRGPYPEG